VLKLLICKLAGHRIRRRKVWNDGVDFRTTCQRCGEALIRGDRRWRLYDSERDDSPMREPHPRDRH